LLSENIFSKIQRINQLLGFSLSSGKNPFFNHFNLSIFSGNILNFSLLINPKSFSGLKIGSLFLHEIKKSL